MAARKVPQQCYPVAHIRIVAAPTPSPHAALPATSRLPCSRERGLPSTTPRLPRSPLSAALSHSGYPVAAPADCPVPHPGYPVAPSAPPRHIQVTHPPALTRPCHIQVTLQPTRAARGSSSPRHFRLPCSCTGRPHAPLRVAVTGNRLATTTGRLPWRARQPRATPIGPGTGQPACDP